jgi:hypothetical protein
MDERTHAAGAIAPAAVAAVRAGAASAPPTGITAR